MCGSTRGGEGGTLSAPLLLHLCKPKITITLAEEDTCEAGIGNGEGFSREGIGEQSLAEGEETPAEQSRVAEVTGNVCRQASDDIRKFFLRVTLAPEVLLL